MTLDDVTENGHSEWPGRNLSEGKSESILQSEIVKRGFEQCQLIDEHSNREV